MKLYEVKVPLTGILSCVVRAANADDAKTRAYRSEYGDLDGESEPDDDAKQIQWETHQVIAEGNVFHGEQNEIEVSDIDEATR